MIELLTQCEFILEMFMATGNYNFDSVAYQRYVADVRKLVTVFSEANEDVLTHSRNYFNESVQDYQEHIKSLLEATNPMDYYRLNRSYLQDSSTRFIKLVEKRNRVFRELNDKLSQTESVLFLFPQEIQNMFEKYRSSGVIELVNPEVWNSFKDKFISH